MCIAHLIKWQEYNVRCKETTLTHNLEQQLLFIRKQLYHKKVHCLTFRGCTFKMSFTVTYLKRVMSCFLMGCISLAP